MSRKLARVVLVAALAAGGCAEIIGFPDYGSPASGGAGGAGTTTTTSTATATTATTTTGSGGQGCAGKGTPCYDGLDDTEGVGSCKGGVVSCDDAGAPSCDDVRPTTQTCGSSPTDENCDGMTSCTGAFRWSVDAIPATTSAVTAGADGTVAVVGASTATAGSVLVSTFDARGRSCWGAPAMVGKSGTLTPLGVALSGAKHTADGKLTQVTCQGSAGLAASTVVFGYATGNVDFGSGTQSNAGEEDAFVAVVDPTGSVVWGQLFGSSGSDRVAGAAVDASGNIYVTGYVEGPAGLGPCGLEQDGGANGDPNTFVAKLGPDGSCAWATTWTGNLAGTGIAIGPDDNLVVIGRFFDTIDFGGGTMLAAGPATNNTFVVRVSATTGVLVGSPVTIDVDNGNDPAVAVGPDNGVFVAGTFTGTYTTPGGSCSAATQQAYLQVLDPTLVQEHPRCYSSTSDAGAVSVGSFGVVVDGAGDVVIGLSSSAPVLGYANPIDAGGLILVKLIAPYDAPLWTRSFGTTATVTPGLVTSYIAGGALAVDGMGFVAITASPSAPIDLGGATTAATGAFVLDLAP
jgi:hypothetical protein